MRLLIVNLNKLVRIISRRNRLVSKIALGDHLVGWSSIRGSIFRRIGYDQGGYSLFLTRARARGVRGYFWDSGSFRRRPGCGRRFCDFRKTFIFCANLLPDAFFDRLLMECSIFCEKRDLGRLRSCSYSRKRRKASLLKGKCIVLYCIVLYCIVLYCIVLVSKFSVCASLGVFARLCASLRIFARFAIHRFTAIRGKLRVSEVCSNKLKFSPL